MIRESMAVEEDRAVSRILPNKVLVEIARVLPRTTRDLARVKGFRRGDTRFWGEVIQRALDSDPRTWPARERPPRGLPSRQTWASDYPESWERFSTARTLLDDLSADLAIPAENILKPATLRSVAWGATVAREIRTPLDLPDVLRGHQARNWQIELTAPVLTDTLF